MPNPAPTPAQVRELLARYEHATPGKWYMTQPNAGFASINDESGDLVFCIAYPSLGMGDKARPSQEVEANAALLIPIDPEVLRSWLLYREALEEIAGWSMSHETEEDYSEVAPETLDHLIGKARSAINYKSPSEKSAALSGEEATHA